ncbi:beta-1,6-galactofuranosyltransferase [Weissella muntiaci]|uniref:Beta-1,6-galactofuranosyltransferase n=1 Tax=Weissella muntiaci TaxID=2508881 RepID=A0A6C2CAL9_9LACO|nr:beta-1,6-galactofuranosyltransferase [Weissella muntiaci]TYC50656.1 beta-1,6-galactofuranosyltransferase [Weissella muntiaci]
MTNWITHLNLVNEESAISVVTRNTVESAKMLGFQELNHTRYANLDNNPKRRKNILEALLLPVQPGDLVVIQIPLWPQLNFQAEFIAQLKTITNVKIVALVHDIPTWMFGNAEENYDIENDFWFQQLRQFDVLLMANDKAIAKLKEFDVNVPMISMKIWDYVYQGPIIQKKFTKKLYYVSGREINSINYTSSTPLHIYDKNVSKSVIENPSVIWKGFVPSDEIIANIDGGFGVVMSENFDERTSMNFTYYNQFNNPTKLSFYIAAGLPVIVESKSAHAKLIQDRGIGLVVDNLNDIDAVLAKIDADKYASMLTALQPWQKNVSEGFFIQRALVAALRYINLGFDDVLS